MTDQYLQFGALGLLAVVILFILKNVTRDLIRVSEMINNSNVIQARILDRLEQIEKDLENIARKLSGNPDK